MSGDDATKGQPAQADTPVPYVPEGTLDLTIAQVAQGVSSPTINEWPEGERRGYDRYAQEVAMLGYEQAEQKRARCELVEEHEAIVWEREPGVRDALRRLVAVLARERQAVYGRRTPLGERELCRTWGEWLVDAAIATVPAEDDVRSSEHLLTCAEAERQAHDAWTDEVYAAEEIERMADGENERITDL